MSSIADAALAAGARIGRYFSVVSFLPSLVLVAYLLGLLEAGAWTGPFVPSSVVGAVSGIDLSGLAVIGVAALAVGVMLHPFQFAMTQALEGYWGSSQLADRMVERRARRHRAAALDLMDRRDAHGAALNRLASALHDPEMLADLAEHPEDRREANEALQDSRAGDAMIGHVVRQESAARALGAYPAPRRIRPTRLGNALRRYEDLAGTQYGLRAIPVAPHLALVADPAHVAYQSDARQELDLSVRVCYLAVLATVATAVLLADDGPWVLLAVVPYALAYLAYRGAVSAAHGYGTAVSTILDLNRFRLYESLRLPLPEDQDAERAQNALLLQALAGGECPITYKPLPIEVSLVPGADSAGQEQRTASQAQAS